MQTYSSISNPKVKGSSIPFFAERKTSPFFKPAIQPKLTIGPVNDPYEREADAVADQVMRMSDTEVTQTGSSPMGIQRKCASCEEEDKVQMKGEHGTAGSMSAPSAVNDVINSGGQPLDTGTRRFMESRFGHDFGDVQVHDDSLAHQTSADINALAYTHRNHIVFGQGQFRPGSDSGKQLLAHELAHVVQQNKDHKKDLIQHYRPKDSANFKTCNTSLLKEDSFSISKDKDAKPWIEAITVHFNAVTTDSNKDVIPTGTLDAVYFKNSISSISSPVAGGKASQGLTDSGNHKVLRIEGCGYHHTSVPKADRIAKHSRAGKYHKDTSKATMNFAVFFVQGDRSGNQAIHEGSFQTGSLACVHVPDQSLVQQINYHSVEKLTKVTVTYDSAALKTLCCERFKAVRRMVSNPCKGQSSGSCP